MITAITRRLTTRDIAILIHEKQIPRGEMLEQE